MIKDNKKSNLLRDDGKIVDYVSFINIVCCVWTRPYMP